MTTTITAQALLFMFESVESQNLPWPIHAWPRVSRLLVASLALALLQACSAVKLVYNTLPDVGYWWLDSYVDFNDAQTVSVRGELDRLLLWHRTEELPKIISLLQKAQRLADTDLAAEPVCALADQVRERLRVLSVQAEPAMVALAMSLGPDQITHIERKFAKANAQWREDWLDGSVTDRLAQRVKNSVERSEQFYGPLDERQRLAWRTRLTASAFDPEQTYAERLRRQQDLLQILRLANGAPPKPEPAAVTAMLRAHLDRFVQSPNPVYRSYSDRLLRESCQTFAEVHNITTPEQRERAMRRLGAYERDAQELQTQR